MERADLTQKEVARRSGLDVGAVSAIVNDKQLPTLKTLGRMVTAIGTTYGELFDEPRIQLSYEDAELSRRFRAFLDRLIENDAAQKPVTDPSDPVEPGPDRIRDAGPASQSHSHEIEDLPNEPIPEWHYRMGARRAFRVLSDCMMGDGILKGAIIYVRPTIDVGAADGQIIVCILNRIWYLKRLDLRSQQKTLDNAHPRYPTLVVGDRDDFKMVGIVSVRPAE